MATPPQKIMKGGSDTIADITIVGKKLTKLEAEDKVDRVQLMAEKRVRMQDHWYIGLLFCIYTLILIFFVVSNEWRDFRNDKPIFFGFFIFFLTVVVILLIMWSHSIFMGNYKKRMKGSINKLLQKTSDVTIEDEGVKQVLNSRYGE